MSATANEMGSDYWLSKGDYQVAANDVEDDYTHKRLRLTSYAFLARHQL